jgi:hypothetical protein
MFRSRLKQTSGGPWPYFATLLNRNVDLHLFKRVSVCGCMSVHLVRVRVRVRVCVCACSCARVCVYLSGLEQIGTHTFSLWAK